MMGKYNSNLLSVVKIKNRGEYFYEKLQYFWVVFGSCALRFLRTGSTGHVIAVTLDNLNSGGGNVNSARKPGWQIHP